MDVRQGRRFRRSVSRGMQRRRRPGGSDLHRRRLGWDGLEARPLLAVNLVPGAVIDVAPLPGNQSDPAIAINPNNPKNIVVMAANTSGIGMVESYSFDGGVTWKTQTLANGYGIMVPANGNAEPSLAFDKFGNLFAGYINSSDTGAVIALSTDGGVSFVCLTTVTSPPGPGTNTEKTPLIDHPTIAVRPSMDGVPESVWLTFEAYAHNSITPTILGELLASSTTYYLHPSTTTDYSLIAVSGAEVTGLGASNVIPFSAIHGSLNAFSPFSEPGLVPQSNSGGFPSIAVGPQGQVIVAFQNPTAALGPSVIQESTVTGFAADPFSTISTPVIAPVLQTALPVTLPNGALSTKVGGADTIPPAPVHGVNASVHLAYDLSPSPHHGRLYLVYTDSPSIGCGCTSIDVIYSDDNGQTWSSPIPVNDNTFDSAQILPSIAVDPTSGSVGVSFYSARNDFGFGPGDRDGHPNNDVEVYVSVGTYVGGQLTFSPNVQVAPSPSESAIAGFNNNLDFNDYTGLAFYGGLMYPVWADNSVTLAGNPQPNTFDIATSAVTASYLTAHVAPGLTAVEGIPFQGTVGTFLDINPDSMTLGPADYSALINWGDGQPSTLVVITGSAPSYEVAGSHTYAHSGTYPITITITNLVNGQSAVATGTVRVNVLPISVSGMLNPASDTGVSNHDAITSINQPNFLGTTRPGAVVQLFAQAVGPGNTPMLVGQTTADALGDWSITTTPLADGSYIITVTATDVPMGSFATAQILPSATEGPLVIDTLGPVVSALQYNPLAGQVIVTLQDILSGFDPASVLNPANYILSNASRASQRYALTGIQASAVAGPPNTEQVTLTFNGGQKLRGIHYLLEIISGGIEDIAGNALDGEFDGLFPSGNGVPGGDFLARLDAIHRTVNPPSPVTGAGNLDPPSGRPSRTLRISTFNPSRTPSAFPRGPARIAHRLGRLA
jgi:hypothetical protein